MSEYFPKPHEPFGGDINFKVNLSNYATKANLKDATGIDTSNIDKLVPVSVDLSKLSDVVKNDAVKKTILQISYEDK